MKLTLEQVRHVASLARLSLDTEEETRLQSELSAILEAIEKINALDLTGVSPTFQVNLEQVSPLAADIAVPGLNERQVLANAPAKVGTSFSVPKVIE